MVFAFDAFLSDCAGRGGSEAAGAVVEQDRDGSAKTSLSPVLLPMKSRCPSAIQVAGCEADWTVYRDWCGRREAAVTNAQQH